MEQNPYGEDYVKCANPRCNHHTHKENVDHAFFALPGVEERVCGDCAWNPDSRLIWEVGRTSTDKCGESSVAMYLVNTTSLEEAKRLFGVARSLEGERCTHSYDCCGHWYNDAPIFVFEPFTEMFIVLQYAHINI